jgi:hypothetical protein
MPRLKLSLPRLPKTSHELRQKPVTVPLRSGRMRSGARARAEADELTTGGGPAARAILWAKSSVGGSAAVPAEREEKPVPSPGGPSRHSEGTTIAVPHHQTIV